MANTTANDDFVKLLEESYSYSFSVADVIKGIVLKKENDGYLIDIGAKTEAFLSNREITNNQVQDKDYSQYINIGDIKEFYILREESDDEDGRIALSLKRLSCAKAWQELQNAKFNNETIKVTVVSMVRGGVIVETNDLRGFIPASQLRTAAPFDSLIGQEIEVKVLESDAKRNKLIMSQRQAVAEQREAVVDEVLSKLEPDSVVKGEVVRIADFGAFVDINGIDGLLPISEISWQRIKHPSDVISLGQTIEVKILKIDTVLKRISLSLKRMGDNPWEEIESKFQEGQVIKGTVNKVTSFGAFINIFPGVEALLPSAEMEPQNANPFQIYNVGDEIEVLIKKFTPQEHRIALSVKDLPKA